LYISELLCLDIIQMDRHCNEVANPYLHSYRMISQQCCSKSRLDKVVQPRLFTVTHLTYRTSHSLSILLQLHKNMESRPFKKPYGRSPVRPRIRSPIQATQGETLPGRRGRRGFLLSQSYGKVSVLTLDAAKDGTVSEVDGQHPHNTLLPSRKTRNRQSWRKRCSLAASLYGRSQGWNS
jgi:hypothetical protein